MTRAKSKPDAMTKMQMRASEKAAERYALKIHGDDAWCAPDRAYARDAFAAGAAWQRRRDLRAIRQAFKDHVYIASSFDCEVLMSAIRGKR